MADTSAIRRRLADVEDQIGLLARIIRRLVPSRKPRRQVNRLSSTLSPHEAAGFTATMRAHGFTDSDSRHRAIPSPKGTP